MDKEDVVHITMEYYTQPQKEPLWVSSSEVDEPRVCYTEWSRSEKENQILYINTYIHMESRKTVLMNLSTGKEWRRHRCREWTHGCRRGKRERDEQRKPRQHIYTITCKTDSQWGPAVYHRELSLVLSDDLEGRDKGKWEGSSRGNGYMYTIADSQ